MDREPEAIVNRDEPIPVLVTGTRNRSASELSTSSGISSVTNQTSGKIQDRLFSAIFRQILPTQDVSDADEKVDRKPQTHVERPGFSVGAMSNNFRRFNARIGVMFVFQNRMIQLLSWRTPSHTLSFLAVYTFCCLDPSLLAVLPLVGCLYFIMIPAFLSRHPPPPNSRPTEVFSMTGPASAPAKTVKPAPEMSKDFFRNMRDLQNCMEDFSVIHDRMIALIAPLTNFSNETKSSVVFLCLCISAGALFLIAGSLPWRTTFLVGGWATICSMHPAATKLAVFMDQDDMKTRARGAGMSTWQKLCKDIVLDEPPDTREVEVFELQRHEGGPEWQPWIYSPSPYDPLSPSRISGDRPKGTRFFEDVQAPRGWEWKDKKWTLDLLSREWVEERMITAVEIETEGERWVYDISVGETQSAYEYGSSPRSGDRQAKGEWRRRRWVRVVQRKTSDA